MNKNKIERLTDNNISSTVKEIIAEGSYFKSKIFKAYISKGTLTFDVINRYKKYLNDIIKVWENYADELSSNMKNATGIVGVNTIDYNYVKDFIYNKDDYASILQFTDGVIQGIKSEKFKEADDVEDFFKYTVRAAFHDRGESTASLLDEVISNGFSVDMMKVTTESDVHLFNSIKNRNIFHSTDANELRKSTSKVIDFITDEMENFIKEVKEYNPRMFIVMINQIIEYIVYSLTVYVTRIYIISKYAYPFISYQSNDKFIPVQESKEIKSDKNDSDNDKINSKLGGYDIAINIMHNASEIVCRDNTKFKEYIEILGTFSKAIGADNLFGTTKPEHYRDIKKYLSDDNVFVDKLISNPLYEYLIGNPYIEYGNETAITEMNNILKEYIFNTNHAYATSYTAKQEILYIIRQAKYETTTEGYKKLVKDMYVVAGALLTSIADIIFNIEKYVEDPYTKLNTTTTNDSAQVIKTLKDLYTELAVAFLHKGRDIELHYNSLINSKISSIENNLSLKLPYQDIDLDSNINMMNSVPDTTRVPYDILELYDMPTFESLEMYDEYLTSISGMEDDEYLSEANVVSNIINAIFSRIKSVYNRFFSFVNDKRFISARKWTLDHQSDLLSMDYNGKELVVLPYKGIINNKENVTLPKGWKNLISNLNKFDEKIIESEESRKEFIKSLYPDPNIYSWFTGDDNKSGPEMYRNHILFYSLEGTKKEVPPAIKVSGNDLKNAVENWINTMHGAPDVLNDFKRSKDEIETAVNHVKSKMVSIENTAKQKEINNKNESVMVEADNSQNDQSKKPAEEAAPVEVPKTGAETVNTNNDKTDNKNNDEKTPTVSNTNEALLIEVQTAIMRLWGSLNSIFINYYLTEYKYIKDAYTVGRSSKK